MAAQRISAGVCYGKTGYGFPKADIFMQLGRTQHIRNIRLYEPDRPLLDIINNRNSGIGRVILGVPNDLLESFYSSDGYAIAKGWVTDNVRAYEHVRFKVITVGEQVNPENIKGANLVTAMTNVKNAIDDVGLGNSIKVSTVVDAQSALVFNEYPSGSQFQKAYANLLGDVLPLLVSWRAPLLVNVHPFRFYLLGQSPPHQAINRNLAYAMFTFNKNVVADQGRQYNNLFDAILDAVYWAVESVVGADQLEIVVSETGWPTSGTDSAATTENASTYNTNLLNHVKGTNGTPKKPGRAIETYVLSMFDENGKLGPNFEKNWGIYEVPVPLANATAKYRIDFGP